MGCVVVCCSYSSTAQTTHSCSMMLSAPFKSYSQLPLTITVVRFHLPGVPSSRWQSRSSYVFCPTILLPLHTMFPCIYILICLNRPPFLSSSRLLLYLASVTHIHPQTMVGGTAIHTIGASSGPSKPSAQRRPRQSGGGSACVGTGTAGGCVWCAPSLQHHVSDAHLPIQPPFRRLLRCRPSSRLVLPKPRCQS